MKKLIILSVLLGSSAALANKPVGPAGCGLGNVIFGKETQILAATTNGSSYSQTFGITSGTSNCESKNGQAKLDAFVEANKVALANDVARGNGETVAGLSKILGCQNATEVNATLKQNFDSIFPSQNESASNVSKSIVDVLKGSQVSCSHLG